MNALCNRSRGSQQIAQALEYGDNGALAAHDEAMRMQALAIGAQIVSTQLPSEPLAGREEIELGILTAAKWTYREATGREW